MTLALLIPGLLMGGGDGGASGPGVVVVGVHKRVGVVQPDVPVAGGGHGAA